MTVITGGLSKTQTYELYNKQSSAIKGQDSLVDMADSILTQNYTTSQKIEHSISGRDCKDDGKISTGSKFCNFFKGIGNSIKNGLKSLCTPKGLLKTALAIGACAIPYIGPVIAFGMLGVGAVKGAVTVGKGIKAANNATTDAEAEQAWQNIGSGSFQVALSVAPMKGLAKTISKNGGVASSITKFGNKVGLEGKTVGEVASSAGKGISNKFKNVKEGVNEMRNINKNYNGRIDKAVENFNKGTKYGGDAKRLDQAVNDLNKARSEALKQQARDTFKTSSEKFDNLKSGYEQMKEINQNYGKKIDAAKEKFANDPKKLDQTLTDLSKARTKELKGQAGETFKSSIDKFNKLKESGKEIGVANVITPSVANLVDDQEYIDY